MYPENEIIKRQSVIDMAAAYESAVANINQTEQLLKSASERLALAFSDRPGFGVFGHGSNRWDRAEILKDLKRCAWRAICEQMQIRRMMSTKRRDELDKAIENGELPDITADNIFATCNGMLDNVHDYLNEAVAEVFEFLRPPHSHLKTNTEYEIGHKVIVRAFYAGRWDNKPHIGYRQEQDFRNLDNVFSLLDGRGALKTYGGQIADAVKNMWSFGELAETDYFRIRVHKNGNMHIEFKRLDLVKKLNEIAGGNRLRNAG